MLPSFYHPERGACPQVELRKCEAVYTCSKMPADALGLSWTHCGQQKVRKSAFLDAVDAQNKSRGSVYTKRVDARRVLCVPRLDFLGKFAFGDGTSPARIAFLTRAVRPAGLVLTAGGQSARGGQVRT